MKYEDAREKRVQWHLGAEKMSFRKKESSRKAADDTENISKRGCGVTFKRSLTSLILTAVRFSAHQSLAAGKAEG